MAKILLVEDDNNLRDIYGERLMAEGYEIVSASDGEEALQIAAQQKPDLVISDVMMPKISGFDMLDILRQTPETKDIKIIMMTALSQAEDKTRADKLGADKYLVKSQVTLEDVARVVHDILGDGEPNDDQSSEDNNEPADADAQASAPATVQPQVSEQPVAPAPTPEPEPAAPAPAPEQPVATPSDAAAEPATATPDPSATVQPTVPAADPTATAMPEPAAPAQPLNTDLPSEPMANTSLSTPQNNDVTQAPAVNPISGGTDAPTANQSQAQQDSNSQADSATQEMADVQKQIESFVENGGQEVAQHTEPVKEPTEQDLIHAERANEDPKVVPAASAKKPDPTIPPIQNDQTDSSSPEPASNRKKIIQPINDVETPDIHKLYEQQMAEEAASSNVAPTQSAEQNDSNSEQNSEPTEPANPPAQPQTTAPTYQEEQVINPIAKSDEPEPDNTPELETVDVNSITGMQQPEEEDSGNPIPTQLPSAPQIEEEAPSDENAIASANLAQPNEETQASAEPTVETQKSSPANDGTGTLEQANQTDQQSAEDQKPLDPNDPNNFAL